MQKRNWYPLDNAANIYPVIQHKGWTSMFRLTAVMHQEVEHGALERALERMRPRFPGFYVRLRRGMFWYYLEQADVRALVEEDTLNPCAPVGPNELPFRVKVHHDRISCEFAHVVCDGGGGMTFFKSLLAEYARELGAAVPCENGIFDLSEPPHPEELEDGFSRFSRMGARPNRSEPHAYHPTGTPLHTGMRVVTTGTISVKQALGLSRKYGVSLTEYMTATLLYVLYKMQLAERVKRLRPVKVSVPVNLRKYYPTGTLRNFSQYLNPGIDPNYGEFTFEETLEQVHHYFRYMFTEKNLNARISKNVGDERNIVLRVVPLFLKKLSIRLVYELTGESVYSSVLSNIGSVELPDVMRGFVRRFDFVLCTARRNTVECGMISYGDALSVSFTRSIAEPYVERTFFRALVRQGLHVVVESNQP